MQDLMEIPYRFEKFTKFEKPLSQTLATATSGQTL